MITRIDRLQNFGIFRDFLGGDQSGVPPFKKRNLIYGWNYSGKTTLSRLFQSLQNPTDTLPHSDCRFRIACCDGIQATQATRSLPHPVRVFNRDYIERNFRQEHTAPAVFIVGEENVALRNQLDALRQAQADLRDRIGARRSEIQRIERADSTAATTRASAVGGMLGVRDFRKPDLDRRIGEVRGNIAEHQRSQEQVEATLSTFRNGDQFSAIALLQQSLPDLQAAVDRTIALLRRTASFDAIEGLRENRELEEWLRLGLPLHSGSEPCRFCGGTVPPDRLEALRRHFSRASQELLAEVNATISRLEALRFEAPRVGEMQFLQEQREQAAIPLRTLEEWLEYAASIRGSLVSALSEKRTALEVELQWEGDLSRLNEGTESLGVLNDCIRNHNERISNLATVRREARSTLERHFAAVHFVEQEISVHEANIQRLQKRCGYAESGVRRLDVRATVIAAQIDRAARGAERFMGLVTFLLKGSDIEVTSIGESQFRLVRGTHPADRLSDGEKTAIAFAYFLTSLEGDGEDLERTVVYIDDPISSLDSNHVYAVFSLISGTLERSKQLFVSTHNSEFFSLLKGRWLVGRTHPRDSEAFYVRRQSDANGSYSQIEALPPLLRRYKSEYEFIFAQLHGFASSNQPSEFEAYNVPNLLRRFLEAYLGFRKPCTTAWHDKLDLILDSAEECGEVHKLLDDASHLQNTNRALSLPSFVTAAQTCVRSVLRGLEAKDNQHFQSLSLVVTNNT